MTGCLVPTSSASCLCDSFARVERAGCPRASVRPAELDDLHRELPRGEEVLRGSTANPSGCRSAWSGALTAMRAMETSASCEARSAPLPTRLLDLPCGSGYYRGW